MVKSDDSDIEFFLSERTRTLLYQSSSFIIRCQIWEAASERRGDVTLYMMRKRPVSDSTAAGCEHSCSSLLACDVVGGCCSESGCRHGAVGMLCLGAADVQTSAVAALLWKCPTATI